MANKLTAVEFLWEIIGNIKTNPDDALLIVQSFNQAKQIEKEQIIDAVDYGCSDWGSGKDSEKYYNDAYGK